MMTKKLIKKRIDEHYRIDKEICDICKEEISEDGYSTNEATISSCEGECYGQEEFSTIKECDICLNCFNEKVIPLLTKEFGIIFRTYDKEDGVVSALNVNQ